MWCCEDLKMSSQWWWFWTEISPDNHRKTCTHDLTSFKQPVFSPHFTHALARSPLLPPPTHYQPCQSKPGCLNSIHPSTFSFISLQHQSCFPSTPHNSSSTLPHTHTQCRAAVSIIDHTPPRSPPWGWEGLPADGGPLCAAQPGAWSQSQNITKPSVRRWDISPSQSLTL